MIRSRRQLPRLLAVTSALAFVIGMPSIGTSAGGAAQATTGEDGPLRSTVTPVQRATGIERVVEGWSWGDDRQTFYGIRASGRVVAWGQGDLGQLGNGTSRGISLGGVVVQRLSHVQKIVSDGATTLALVRQGRVKAWGYNGYGELGTGDKRERDVPHLVGHLRGIRHATLGNGYALALTRHGRVWAWRRNGCGQLGTGDLRDHLRPRRVRALRHVEAVYTSGYNTSFALQRNGTLWSWGYGYDGDRGDGSKQACSSRPHRVRLPAPVTGLFLSAPPPSTYRALLSDGSVWTWGNRSKNLGYPARHTMFAPRRVRGLPAIQRVWPAQDATYVRGRDGSVWAWGAGPLGDGHRRGSARPVHTTAIDGATKVFQSGGDAARFAVLPDGTVKGWGLNWYNGVGTGSLDPVLRPTALPGLNGPRGVGMRLDMGYAWAPGYFKTWASSYDAYADPQDVPWGPRTADGLTGIRWAAPWVDTNYRTGMTYTVLLADGTVQRLNVPFRQPVG
jgi:alpha-tubulin suppressor-like RCC1 family protein